MRIRIHRADVLFSLLIRGRAGFRCEMCGTYYPEDRRQGLHCSHFVGRANKGVRFDPQNACAHCYSCHMKFEGNPLFATDWIKNYLGEIGLLQLTVKAARPFKFDKAMQAHIVRNLDAELKRMEAERANGNEARIEFANPYDGEVQPLPRKARKPRKAKPRAKCKLPSRPFPKAHRPLRRKFKVAA